MSRDQGRLQDSKRNLNSWEGGRMEQREEWCRGEVDRLQEERRRLKL